MIKDILDKLAGHVSACLLITPTLISEAICTIDIIEDIKKITKPLDKAIEARFFYGKLGSGFWLILLIRSLNCQDADVICNWKVYDEFLIYR